MLKLFPVVLVEVLVAKHDFFGVPVVQLVDVDLAVVDLLQTFSALSLEVVLVLVDPLVSVLLVVLLLVF